MFQQPVRLGGLALLCALATSALLLVTFLASNLLLSVIGGIGGVAQPAVTETPVGAVLLSAEREPEQTPRCDRRRQRAHDDRTLADRTLADRTLVDRERCAERRGAGGAARP